MDVQKVKAYLAKKAGIEDFLGNAAQDLNTARFLQLGGRFIQDNPVVAGAGAGLGRFNALTHPTGSVPYGLLAGGLLGGGFMHGANSAAQGGQG